MKMVNLIDLPEKKSMIPLNLQMFAAEDDQKGKVIDDDDFDEFDDEDADDAPDEDDVDDDDVNDQDEDDDEDEDEFEDEDDDSEDEDESEDEQDDDDSDKKPQAPLKKAERKIVDLKRQNKELQSRLEKMEKERREKEDNAQIQKRTDELIEQGFDKESAKNTATTEIQLAAAKRREAIRDIAELDGKYPRIGEHASELIELKAKNPDFSYEELYRAKFQKESEFDRKTQAELEAVETQNKAKKKSGKSGARKSKSGVKMNKTQRKQYEYMKSRHPEITAKEFMKLWGDDQITED